MLDVANLIRAAGIATSLLVFGEQRASACIRGPLPLKFAGNTSRLSDDGRFFLQHYGIGQRRARLLIIFYKSDLPPNVERARQATVRDYLKSIGRNDFAVVQSDKPIPATLVSKFGHRFTASVEPAQGCG